jgi:transmembrane sensor
MTTSPAVTELEMQRMDEALQWLETLRDSAMDEGAVAAWLRWSSEPENLQEFERLQGIWDGVGRLDRAALLPSPARAPARRSVRLAWAAGLVLMVGASLGGYWVREIGGRSYGTEVAMTSEIALSDGSRVELAPLSRISARFTDESRVIDIESGEAYFDVAKDPLRPFIVKTDDVQVLAVGTAFNVHKIGGRVRVTVTEGVVSVSATNMDAAGGGRAQAAVPVQASAGQQVEYSVVDRRMQVAGANVEIATAWRSGMLKFVNEPLGNVVADLNRYTDRKILIEDESLEALPYTGTVFSGRIDQWLLALQDAFPLVAEEQGPHQVRLKTN